MEIEDASERWLIAGETLFRRQADLLQRFGVDPIQWPGSFDIDRIGPTSTEQWANDFCWSDGLVGKAESTWVEWATSWPLPVGRRALFQDFPPSKGWDPSPFSRGVPWLDYEYAFLIHTVEVGANTVTTFCLVDRKVAANPQRGEPVVWFSKAGIHFVIQGPDPTGFVVSEHVDLAQQWWANLEVLRMSPGWSLGTSTRLTLKSPKGPDGLLEINPGRRIGSTARSFKDYKAAYKLIVGENLRKPTREEYVSRSGIPETTLERRLRDWGYTWSEFSEECWNMRLQSQALRAEEPNHTQPVIIMGQGHSIHFGSGSSEVKNVTQQVIAGNLDSLKSLIRTQGVDEEDLEALDGILAEAEPADVSNVNSRLRNWIEKVSSKASKGATDVAKTAIRELILLSVRHYFGEMTGDNARPVASPSE